MGTLPKPSTTLSLEVNVDYSKKWKTLCRNTVAIYLYLSQIKMNDGQ
jgi:hypothetical protein